MQGGLSVGRAPRTGGKLQEWVSKAARVSCTLRVRQAELSADMEGLLLLPLYLAAWRDCCCHFCSHQHAWRGCRCLTSSVPLRAAPHGLPLHALARQPIQSVSLSHRLVWFTLLKDRAKTQFHGIAFQWTSELYAYTRSPMF